MHIKHDLPNVLVTYCNYRSTNRNTVGYSLIYSPFLSADWHLSFQMVTHLAHLTGAPANGMDLPYTGTRRRHLSLPLDVDLAADL